MFLRVLVIIYSAGLVIGFSAARVAETAAPGINGRLAFSSSRDSSFLDIYSMGQDGSDQQPLTLNPNIDIEAAWSPDGSKIAFSSDRDGPPFQTSEIYLMATDGTAETNITQNPGFDTNPAWSPDGTKIAFESVRANPIGGGTHHDVYVMNADGTGQTRVTTQAGSDGSPAWSPDGTQIAFVSDRDGDSEIYIMDANGGNQLPLTTDPADDDHPDWSPDCNKIAFQSDRDTPGWHDIYTLSPGDKSVSRITTDPKHDEWPAWSPNGQQIAFHSSRQDNRFQVFVMNADGSSQANVSNSPYSDAFVAWQPIPPGVGGIAVLPALDPRARGSTGSGYWTLVLVVLLAAGALGALALKQGRGRES
jgi:Tol biopolymer transport system component